LRRFGHFDIFDVFNSFNAAYVRQIQLLISVPLKFHDLRLRRFGLVLALSLSGCREAMLAASGSFEKYEEKHYGRSTNDDD
jgi:hypothetical protein